MGAIGDVFMRMLFEDQQLTAEAKRAGTKVGDAAGKSMSQRIKSSLGPAIATGVGTVLGAGFAIAAKGAAELDAATRQFQADTGATAEEATKASHAIAGMYRDNLQGFDQISAALSKVHTDLGLTGQAAEDATGLFLKFSTATGQDAGQAVADFDDILDAWNLTAADAGPLMDKLIAGRNRFGGVLSENQDALSKMAPAMTAANMTVDDGIALLNLFQTAGIDASKAPAALAKAVKLLKPGQDINDLIVQISSIEDPTLRAQKAMEIFGVRGGTQFAQAFKPGIDSLQDFNTTIEENTDATTKAADAIESSFGNQFKLILKNAGGALAEFGNNFGPLLLVAGQFGPKMITAIGGGLGAIAGKLFPGLIARLIPAALVAGATTGTAMGGAAAATEVATQAAGVAAGQAAVAAGAVGPAGVAGSLIGRAMGLAAAAAIPALIIGAVAAGIALSLKSIDDFRTEQDKLMTEANLTRAEAIAIQLSKQSEADRQTAFKRGAGQAFTKEGTTFEQALASAQLKLAAARPAETGGQSPDDRDNDWQGGFVRGIDQLHEDLVKAIETIKATDDPKALAAALAAVLKSVLGGEGNAAQTKAIVTELTAKRDAALARGDTATATLFSNAIARLEPFAKGRQWQAEQIAEARKIVASNATTAEKVAALKGIQADLLSHQRTMAGAIVGKLLDVETAVNKVRIPTPQIISQIIGGGGPTPPKTPPKAPPKAGAINPGGGVKIPMRAAGGPVTSGVPYWVGERGIPELFVPRASGTIVPVADVAQSGSDGSFNPTINVQGLIPYRDPFTIATELKRLRDFVVVTPRRQPT